MQSTPPAQPTPADQARQALRRHFGVEAAHVWAAPGRVNLIGEHTDYNDGYVLPFALPRRTAAAVARADQTRWRVWSEQTRELAEFGPEDLTPGAVAGWAGYVAGVLWALREEGVELCGAEIAVASDVPTGAGLSSSAALECAVLAAMNTLCGGAIPRSEWPRIAQRAENVYVGMPCGIMDQSASTLAREGHALFLDCRTLRVEHTQLQLDADSLAVLVIDTKAPHRLVSGEYASRRADCEKAAELLGVPALRDVVDLSTALASIDDEVTQRRVRHAVTENQRVLDTVELLRAGQIRQIGPLMTASHRSLRDDYEVTVGELDTAVDAALAAGAYGARMTGGGFGGCVLALVDSAGASRVAEAVTAAFAEAGFAPPVTFSATPAGGVAQG
ncbi:MAG: galactokinase [Micromonosporaceae bacterium]